MILFAKIRCLLPNSESVTEFEQKILKTFCDPNFQRFIDSSLTQKKIHTTLI